MWKHVAETFRMFKLAVGEHKMGGMQINEWFSSPKALQPLLNISNTRGIQQHTKQIKMWNR
jgi:hypothetical protein